MASDKTSIVFKFTQVILIVADLEKSLLFHTVVLGMKELTHLDLDTVALVFLGYPVGTASEDIVAPEDIMAPEDLMKREGVIELAY